MFTNFVSGAPFTEIEKWPIEVAKSLCIFIQNTMLMCVV